MLLIQEPVLKNYLSPNLKINPRLYHFALISFCLIIFILSSIPGEELSKVDFEFNDKLAHFIVYGILCILFFYSLKNQTKSIKLQKYALEFAFLFTALYGVTDEVHQYFVPKRSCELSDWIADALGALMMYSILKIYYFKTKIKRAAIFALIPFFLFGCSGTSEMDGLRVSISEAEAWLDLMPVIGKADDPLGFLISLNVESADVTVRYEIKDLKIYFNNDTVMGKRFETEIFPPAGGITKINLFQLNEETYLNKSKEQPQEAQFTYTLYANNKKVRTLKTSKLIIKKVY